ncbi:MAG: polysaccharide deacetylase [Frankiales bacterium]|nr:polysaccharide deacetylase [Frankiales bacterium]
MRAPYRRTTALAAALAVVSLTSAACGGSGAPAAAPSRSAAASSASASPSPAADPAAVKANELGQIPVLMYHQLVAQPRGVYDQTPAQYKAELESVYAHGFRTVTAAALVAGKIDLPAGQKPVVLTFDDSTVSQYGELPDGSVDPSSAVGILLAVANKHGDDSPVATFYVNADPFAGKDAYLAKLVALGMELGDHTASHANLKQLDDAGVQRELREGLAVITKAAPDAVVTTMALPLGVRPRNKALAAKGSGYSFAGVMAVGSNPAPSPYSARFNPMYVPRIRSGLRTGDQAFTSTDWLPQLYSGKVSPYVSDGDPDLVSFPRSAAGRLNPRFASSARPY